MKTDLFQSCGHYWVFQICWHIESSTFPASSFRIWNSSTGIPSPPFVLFIVMLPKAHLTSHSKMSGFRWMITSSWLSGSWRSFFYSSSVYSWELPHIWGHGQQPRGATPHPRSWAAAKRSYPTSEVRRGNFVQGKEQRLCFTGAAVKRYLTSKIRETQVRQ